MCHDSCCVAFARNDAIILTAITALWRLRHALHRESLWFRRRRLLHASFLTSYRIFRKYSTEFRHPAPSYCTQDRPCTAEMFFSDPPNTRPKGDATPCSANHRHYVQTRGNERLTHQSTVPAHHPQSPQPTLLPAHPQHPPENDIDKKYTVVKRSRVNLSKPKTKLRTSSERA